MITNDDKLNILKKAHAEAENGHLTMALQRISNLKKECKDDADILYNEGLIRIRYAGQGCKAQELFLEAYHHSKAKNEHSEVFLFSAINSAVYARTKEEFYIQLDIAAELAPDDPAVQTLISYKNDLGDGPFEELLGTVAKDAESAKKYSECASFAELALSIKDSEIQDKYIKGLLKGRAVSLRELDKAAFFSRNNRGEGFPPHERICLMEAVECARMALDKDKDDDVLWNLKSAWLILLDKPQEAIEAADEAQKHFPDGIATPLINKAIALDKLGEHEQALATAQKAMDIASEMMDDEEIKQCENIIANLSSIEKPIDKNKELWDLSKRINEFVIKTSEAEFASYNKPYDISPIATGLHKRLSNGTDIYADTEVLKEFITDFSPATVSITLLYLKDYDSNAFINCIFELMIIGSKRDGTQHLEACKILLYLTLKSENAEQIQRLYRISIKGQPIVSKTKFPNLDKHMQQMLASDYPELKEYLDETPLTDEEVQAAKGFFPDNSEDSKTESHDLPEHSQDQVRAAKRKFKIGCAAVVIPMILYIIYYYFFRK